MEIHKAIDTVRQGRKWLLKLVLTLSSRVLYEWISRHLTLLQDRNIIDQTQLNLIDAQFKKDLLG